MDLAEYNYKIHNKEIITDLISRIVQVLKGDLYWVRINVQEVGLMKSVKL